MRQVSVCILVSLGFPLLAGAAARESAFTALTALPIEEMQRVARVAGCEGASVPERWHFIVYAPDAENGYREYVVANHQVVVRREFSQFAEFLRPDAVFGTDDIKVDSDRLGVLAQQFAKANRMDLATYNYELSREGPGLAPRWKVDCFDKSGRTAGTLLVNATQEKVVGHDGFKKEPEDAQSHPTWTAPAPSRRTVPPPPRVAYRQPVRTAVPPQLEPPPEPVAAAPERSPRVRRAQPVQEPPRGPLTRVVRGIFGNDD